MFLKSKDDKKKRTYVYVLCNLANLNIFTNKKVFENE